MNPTPQQDAQRLISMLASLRRVVVALSGGVDSSVVAAAAIRADPRAVAMTAESPSVARWQIEMAEKVAAEIGIEHRLMPTTEGRREEYRRNDGRRCFYCKETLYQSIQRLAAGMPQFTIVSGTNADDLGDYRPGIDAGRRCGVATPLADLGITKTRVRALAEHFQLSNRNLPASPCLASRVAYGIEVTPERLRKIEQAEDWLRRRGFDVCRVRLYEGEEARIEVPQEQIDDVSNFDCGGAMSRRFQDIGFSRVTIDPGGFRSGKMNQTLVTIGPAQLDGTNGIRESDHGQEPKH